MSACVSQICEEVACLCLCYFAEASCPCWCASKLVSLDSIGGPNHLGNMCDSPLLAVPHRALDADGIPDQLDFELAGHPFGEVHGDNKTREELNAEGVPARYLDVGVVVQPMYYYVGHITKFVRPGSRAVRALVDGSGNGPKTRTFRPTEQDVPGGGINDLARIGIEATLWPCEGSTRQEWLLNDEGQLQVFGHDWLGVPTTSCLAKKADKDMGGLMLTTCNVTEGRSGFFEVLSTPDEHRVNIVLKNSKVDSKKSCLVAQPLRNNGGKQWMCVSSCTVLVVLAIVYHVIHLQTSRRRVWSTRRGTGEHWVVRPAVGRVGIRPFRGRNLLERLRRLRGRSVPHDRMAVPSGWRVRYLRKRVCQNSCRA